MPYIMTYLGVTALYLIIDYLWLGVIAKGFYQQQMGDLMREDILIHIAALFYMFYTIGIVLFAVKPAVEAENVFIALSYGALLGFLAYGTYDVTNMATIKNWPILMSLVDVAWGTALTATTATAGYFILKQF